MKKEIKISFLRPVTDTNNPKTSSIIVAVSNFFKSNQLRTSLDEIQIGIVDTAMLISMKEGLNTTVPVQGFLTYIEGMFVLNIVINIDLMEQSFSLLEQFIMQIINAAEEAIKIQRLQELVYRASLN